MTASNVALLMPTTANGQARWTNGLYYTMPGCNVTTSAVAINTMTAHRLPVPPVAPGGTAHTITRAGITLTGSASAGGIIRLGLYKDNGLGVPGALVAEAAGTPANTIDGTQAAGSYEITLTTPWTLTDSEYWLAAVQQVAAATLNVVSSAAGGGIPIGSGTLSGCLNTSRPNGWQVSSVTGALPANWTGNVNNTAPILVGVKVT